MSKDGTGFQGKPENATHLSRKWCLSSHDFRESAVALLMRPIKRYPDSLLDE